MKKRTIYLLVVFTFLLLFGGCNSISDKSFNKMEIAFRNVPNVPLAVYWYWMSDNISEEGVVKDLEAMKRVGINRAFIGNIGGEGVPYGKTPILSDGWWKVMHRALKEATRLDIEIGIFNGPGWSQSGGPWVKPEQSMRYLASTEMIVEGNQLFNGGLPEMSDSAQNVCVIAYPLSDNVGNTEKKSIITNGKDIKIDFKTSKEAPMRTLIIEPKKAMDASMELYYNQDGQQVLLKNIKADRSNLTLHVGFSPLAPIVISLPEVLTDSYQLCVSNQDTLKFDVTLTSNPLVERYPEKTFAKMFQTPLPLWHDYLWERQPEVSDKDLLIAPEKVIDLTEKYNNGILTWEVPEGTWKVVRFAMLPTNVTNAPASPEGTGLETDKMSKQHIESHFEAFIGEILRRIPPEDRKTFKVVVLDSYETGGLNWTDDMVECFIKKYGYNPIPYLLAFKGEIVGNRDISDRFLWDMRRLIADRVAYDYVGGLRDICHKNGLTVWLENYGHWGFPGEFLQYGGQSDEVAGEFWSEGSLGDIENRAASSCAHIYGKPNVWAESFTASGNEFERYPYLMKKRGDLFFTEGINSTLLHVFMHQPYEDCNPGINAWFGNEFNRKNTWFSQMDVFIEYLKRTNYMLQQGRYIADVAYFIGEDTPKMTGVCNPELPKGYSFDYINSEVLMKYATVKNGKLILNGGMEYKILVLPKLESMRPQLLSKIKDFVYKGLTVIGPKPDYSPSLQDYLSADCQVRKMAKELWKEVDSKGYCQYGKGLVFDEQNSLQNVFKQIAIKPDCDIAEDSLDIRFIHRSVNEGEIYFLSNQQECRVSFNATFRTGKGNPELWDALTGEIRPLPQYKQDKNQTTLNIELEPFGSSFIIFRTNEKNKYEGKINFPKGEIIKSLNNDWIVSFDGSGTIEGSVKFDTLYDWSKSKDNNIKYFSGTATYKKIFNLAALPQGDIYIDLGKVMTMGKIYVNDQYAGGVWTYPYRINITKLLNIGSNSIEIKVVNNWKNRLIGDLNLPDSLQKTYSSFSQWKKDSELQESGMLGPVTLQLY